MVTYVEIVDEVSYGVTREATQDEWDHDDTYESHYIRGIRVVDDKRYHDLPVGFEVDDQKFYFLLHATYDTGDSFGRYEGKIEFVGLYQDREVAEENKRRIDKHDRDGDGYSVTLVTEEGDEFECHVPWKGYFESLCSVEVQKVSTV